MLNQIKYASLILFVILILLTIGIYRNAQFAMVMSRGNYFFATTRDNANIKTITMSSPDNKSVTLEKRNNLWYVKEADDYFAAFRNISALSKLLRQSAVYRADTLDEQAFVEFRKNAFMLKTIDNNGNTVDEAFIQPKKEGSKFHYAILNNNLLLYQITGDFSLSFNPMDWIQSPLLSIKDKQIKLIKNKNFQVYRRFAAEDLKDINTKLAVPQIQSLTANLWYLSAIDVQHAIHFDRKKYQKSQSYEIATLGGLIYLLDVFTDGNEYWLNIQMKHEATVDAEDMRLYKENHTLYDGWFFKISPDIGEMLNSFSI
jgi:hypothetical protein